MPLQATSGAASYDGFGGGAAAVIPYYIEDMFSCFLYTGNATARSIVNNIDISGNDGLVWTKSRSLTGSDHFFVDTVRGRTRFLNSNNPAAQVANSDITAFNSDGYSLNADVNGGFNNNGATFASWTFRKQPKFFDIQTWTGSGANRTISHALGSVPGCIIVKRTDTTSDWQVYHRANTAAPQTDYLVLNSNDATADSNTRWNDTQPTDAVFSLGTEATVNASGGTYVAYLWAHDAGGFGLLGTDNVVSCGSYTGNGSVSGPTVTLGYEPQWLMVKRATGGLGSWYMWDNMRGFPVGGNDAILFADLSDAETTSVNYIDTSATGFIVKDDNAGVNASSATYIYIAIRRGPMKVPTTGTSVFYPQAIAQADSIDSTNVPFPPDLVNTFSRNGTGRTTAYLQFQFADRLRSLGTPSNTLVGSGCPVVISSSSAAEVTSSTYIQLKADSQNITRSNGWNSGTYGDWINYFMRRAPSFMDVVCYTGTGSFTTFTHNLTVVPELMIVKRRSATNAWAVYANNDSTDYLVLDTDAATADNSTYWNNTSPTSTVFSVGSNSATNASGSTYVAYLFATCVGVSKVGSYTGTATTKQIDCGFTAGARFVLIKRTDSTGDWYVWDTARGIVSGNDPYLLLNSTAAEVTSTDYVDTYSAGFEISSTAPAAINASGGNFVFLAIA